MNINYTTLSNMQADLDKYIGRQRNLNMEDYKLERIEALSVEYHELLQELRFFKYWSVKPMNRERALEEYVDCLHFLMSIGNDFGVKKYNYVSPDIKDMRRLRFGIMNMISRLPYGGETEYIILFDHFLHFGEKLNFTKNEVLTHYELKHAENYKRQQVGY